MTECSKPSLNEKGDDGKESKKQQEDPNLDPLFPWWFITPPPHLHAPLSNAHRPQSQEVPPAPSKFTIALLSTAQWKNSNDWPEHMKSPQWANESNESINGESNMTSSSNDGLHKMNGLPENEQMPALEDWELEDVHLMLQGFTIR